MTSTPDPYQAHLNRAASLFDAGDVVQAGQIWQAILKRDPANRSARDGLLRVKRFFDQREAEPDDERLLREGCTLFDMGQLQDALHKWERILAHNPQHKLAAAYANDARRELGLAPVEAAAPPPEPVRSGPAAAVPPPAEPAPVPGPGADQLVLEGVQLYDLGMFEEAIGKWERALELAPDQKDAPAYLDMAQREQAQRAAVRRPAVTPPARPASAPTPRRVQGPPPRVLLSAQNEPSVIPLAAEPNPYRPAPVGPPEALTARPAPRRKGFRLPGHRQGLGLPAWFNRPRNAGLAVGLLVLVVLGLSVYGVRRREQALKDAVAAAKSAALKPVSRRVQIPSLAETTEAVRQDAEAALADDPLLAYLRGQEWQRRDPDSAEAQQLVATAKTRMAALPGSGKAAADFDQALQSGDLEGAYQCILGLLRQAPDDPELRARAGKVVLALAPIYATKDRLDDARDVLTLGRALFPGDQTWPAKLKLLQSLQDLSATDRAPWIQLLG